VIKNYTSGVPVSTSVSYIEQKLVAHGATNIVKRYGQDKKLLAIMFQIDHGGHLVPVFLPAKVDAVELVLKRSIRRPKAGTAERVREQAARTAWKLISDWVDVQFAMIQLEQAEFVEIFLPFVWDPVKEETFFARVKAGGYKLLGGGGAAERAT
jgi:hypothetical protein